MTKAVALLFIFMIGLATTMPTLVKANCSCTCSPPATIPGVPGSSPPPRIPGVPGSSPPPSIPVVPGSSPPPRIPGVPTSSPPPSIPLVPGSSPPPRVPGVPASSPPATIPGAPGSGSSPPGTGLGAGNSSCPLDALKLGACVDLLGGLVHLGIGDPVVNQCCPVLAGVLDIEAALCLCTTIRLKLLNLNIMLPVALGVLVQCGMNPPPGFTCPPLN